MRKKTRKQAAKLGGAAYATKYKGTKFAKKSASNAAKARWAKYYEQKEQEVLV